MNDRERTLAVLRYQPYDRLPVVHFGYWDETLVKWAQEGHITEEEAKSWFDGPRDGRSEAAFRNGSLQGAYLILAARALGLDTGPMSGFDNAAVDADFFADEPQWKSNFICSIGHGDPASIFGRSPRPDFGAFNRLL